MGSGCKLRLGSHSVSSYSVTSKVCFCIPFLKCEMLPNVRYGFLQESDSLKIWLYSLVMLKLFLPLSQIHWMQMLCFNEHSCVVELVRILAD